MKRFLKFLIGLILLPFAFIFTYNFMAVIWVMVKNFRLTFPVLLGGLLYFILHRYIYNFSRPYVLAHEFCHALAAWACGYKVGDIEINKESGQTEVSGINTFILLAPYFVPLYALLCIICFYVINLFWPGILDYKNLFLGLLGFFTVFHLMHTYKALTETEQSDITLAGGGVFSFALIAIINLSLIILLINFLFPGLVSPVSIFKNVFTQTIYFWKMFFIYLHKFIIWAGKL